VLQEKFVSASVGKKLRDLRKQKRVSSADLLSERMGGKYSATGILRREEGILKIDFGYIEAFCKATGIEGREKENLLSIARLDFWRSKRSLLEMTKELHEIMLRADTHLGYTYAAIPAEFHTYDYTHSIVSSYGGGDIDERTKVRIEAERKLLSNPSKRQQILCPESVLYISMGSVQIMLNQLEVLRSLSLLPNKQFRILPSDLFLPTPHRESFYLFDSHFVYCQTRIGSITREDDETVAELDREFQILWSHAVDGEERNKLIDKAIEHYRGLSQA
jgi:hypothetical protein